MFQARKITFSKSSKTQVFFQLSHIWCFCSFTFNITRFVSLSSVKADLWNVLINFNLLKLRSILLRTAVIGKLSLWWPQAPFSPNRKPMVIFEIPISNVCSIQLPVTFHCCVINQGWPTSSSRVVCGPFVRPHSKYRIYSCNITY